MQKIIEIHYATDITDKKYIIKWLEYSHSK